MRGTAESAASPSRPRVLVFIEDRNLPFYCITTTVLLILIASFLLGRVN